MKGGRNEESVVGWGVDGRGCRTRKLREQYRRDKQKKHRTVENGLAFGKAQFQIEQCNVSVPDRRKL